MNVIISFSGRKSGNSAQIARFCQEMVPDSTVYRFSDFELHPCGGCQGECFDSRQRCPYASDMEETLVETVCHSKRAIFIVPNHCNYPCANFFSFNERSQCAFQGEPERLEAYLNVPKQFIVISNTVQTGFDEFFVQHTNEVPDILYLSPKAFGKSSVAGDLMTSSEARTTLAAFLNTART